MRQAFAPVGTRLRRVAATEDGGESVFGMTWQGNGAGPSRPICSSVVRPRPFLDLPQPRR